MSKYAWVFIVKNSLLYYVIPKWNSVTRHVDEQANSGISCRWSSTQWKESLKGTALEANLYCKPTDMQPYLQ